MHYLLKDHLGSTRVIVDGSGNVEAYYDYYPFGKLLRSSSSGKTHYRFTGQEWDEENGYDTYNFNARTYDPEVGRFNGVDPVQNGASPYNYCFNNPLIYTDPTGMWAGGGGSSGGGFYYLGEWHPFGWEDKPLHRMTICSGVRRSLGWLPGRAITGADALWNAMYVASMYDVSYSRPRLL